MALEVFGYSDGDAVVGMLAAAWLMAEHHFKEAAAAADGVSVVPRCPFYSLKLRRATAG